MQTVPTPNGASPESSGRDHSNADLVGTDTVIPPVEISSMEHRPWGVIFTVSYTVVRYEAYILELSSPLKCEGF